MAAALPLMEQKNLKETQKYIYWNDCVGHPDQKYYLYVDECTNRTYIKKGGEFLLIPNPNNYCVGYDWFKEPESK